MQTCRLGHPEAVFFRLARASPHPTMPRRPGRARRAAASPLPTMAPGRRRWPPTSSSHRHIRRCAPASTIARSDDGGRPALDLASPFLAMRSTERPFRPANNDPAKIMSFSEGDCTSSLGWPPCVHRTSDRERSEVLCTKRRERSELLRTLVHGATKPEPPKIPAINRQAA